MSGKPDFPFCLCWANETWSGIWHGSPRTVLIEQTYPGVEDHEAHFNTLLMAFTDRRYIRVNGKPLFVIYKPQLIPNSRQTLDLWRNLAARAGLSGLHIVGFGSADWNPLEFGFDAKIVSPLVRERPWVSRRRFWTWLRQAFNKRRGIPTLHSYTTIVDEHIKSLRQSIIAATDDCLTYPCLVHAWDNTPRSGVNGVVLTGSTPDKFSNYMNEAIDLMQTADSERRILFLKSWNEWAEGNHIEPDLKYGHAYLDSIRTLLHSNERSTDRQTP